MKRLTTDNPQENFEIMMNYVFAKDGWAHIRHDGERENVPLTEWVKAQCIKRGCDEFPGETAEEIDMTVCDCLMDGEGCPVALAYCFACQANHLRGRLKAIEDTLGDEDNLDHLRELAQAEKDGRLVVLPCKVGDTVYRTFRGNGRDPVVVETEIKSLGQAADLVGRIGKKSLFVSVYLTRQEAEEALREDEEK